MDTMQRLSQAGVIDAVRQWRNQAGHLRDAASAGHIRLPQKAMLLSEADAADRQADWWSDCLAQEFATTAGYGGKQPQLLAVTVTATPAWLAYCPPA